MSSPTPSQVSASSSGPVLGASADSSTIITADKIFYFQISDATRMDPPLDEKHPAWDGETPARGLWSHDYRPLPYETDKGAYLPVEGERVRIQRHLALSPC